MVKHWNLEAVKTWANEENMIKAMKKKIDLDSDTLDLRWYTAWTKDGRCFPVFVGVKAMEYGIHFHFNIVA